MWHISSKLALAREVLHQLEIAQDGQTLSPAELWLMNSLKKHSLALASLNRTIARSRSRIGWLQEGDANTKLFHMHARSRKKKNFITKLVSNGEVHTSLEDKTGMVDEYYDSMIICWGNAATESSQSTSSSWISLALTWQPWMAPFL